MGRFVATNALGVCSISTIAKRLESKDSIFAPYGRMSHRHEPTVQPHAGKRQRPREAADAEVMHGDRVNPLAAGRFEDGMPTPRTFVSTGRCRLACHERPWIEDASATAGAQTVSIGVYVRPDGIAAATQGTLCAAAGAGLEAHGGTGAVENPPTCQVRKDGPSRALSGLIARVPGRRLYAMNAHTLEQLADPSSACPYQYLLSQSRRREDPRPAAVLCLAKGRARKMPSPARGSRVPVDCDTQVNRFRAR